MIEEIQKQIKLKISSLQSDKSIAISAGDWEWDSDCSCKIRGLEIALEIIEECIRNHGKILKTESASGLVENDVALTMEIPEQAKTIV